MTVAILSRNHRLYTTRRLVEAVRARGQPVRVLDPLRFEMLLEPKGPVLNYEGRRLRRPSVVIPRIGQSITEYGLAVVNQFAMMGVPVMNQALGIARSRNKMRALQILTASGLSVPPTAMARRAEQIADMVERVGGYPVLVKLTRGTHRVGFMLLEKRSSLTSALEAVVRLGENVIIQRYVKETRGADIRALVVGERVVAAVRRHIPAGRFSRNLRRAARFEALEIDPGFAEVAVRAAQIIGLEVAAVDMLDLASGYQVFELNSSPGLREIEEATGLDVAGAMVARALEIAATRPAAHPL